MDLDDEELEATKQLPCNKKKYKVLDREEIDLTTVYISGFYDGEKKWKDKIKAKIEELKKYRDKFYELNMLQDVIIKQNEIQVLQSLLEKE